MAKIAYTKEDKARIKRLKDKGVELSGEESPEELETLSIVEDQEEIEEAPEQEEVEGIPNKMPPRTETIEVGGKKVELPIYFVAAVKGGKQRMYSPTGAAASPAYGVGDFIAGSEGSNPTDGIKYITKACARMNIILRKNIIPGEKI